MNTAALAHNPKYTSSQIIECWILLPLLFVCYQQYHQVDRCERYITLADMTFHLSYWLIKLKPSRYQMKATLKGNTWYYLTFAVILHLLTSSNSFRNAGDWVQVRNIILGVPISPDTEDRFLVFPRREAVWNISCPFLQVCLLLQIKPTH